MQTATVSSDVEFLDDLIDLDDLAAILRIKRASIPPLKARGKLQGIEFYRLGRNLYATRSSAVRFIKARAAA